MKKFLFIQPPITEYSSPHIAIPSLAGQLKRQGIETKCLDYNIDFFWTIFSSKYIKKIIKKNKKLYKKLLLNKNNLNEEQNQLKKTVIISKLKAFENLEKQYKLSEIKKLSSNIKKAIKIKQTNRFYNTKHYIRAQQAIRLLTNIVSIPIAPFLYLRHFLRIDEPLDFKLLKYVILDKENNIFWDFFKQKIKEIKKERPKYIGLSICSEEQLLPALTLAYILKKETKAHINLGGIILSKNIELIKKEPDFFDMFADSLSYGDGEYTICKLAEFINKKISIEDVPGIIYQKEGEIVQNKESEPVNITEVAPPDYSDYCFKKYLSPHVILPIETHRSCYWGKCVFCDINHAKTMSGKTVDQVINEIKNYKRNLGINYFAFVDSAIPPAYLKELFQEIINNKLDIRFSCDARLDNEFNYETLKLAYDAGLRLIAWGYETANQRIAELMRKGINVENSLRILNDSARAGIWNTIYAIIGFPSETYEEAEKTINTIIENPEIIHTACINSFFLPKYSYITSNIEKYNIKKEEQIESFSNFLKYTEENGLTENEIKTLKNIYLENSTLFLSSKLHHCTFLNNTTFVLKYGLNTIKEKVKKLSETNSKYI